MKFTKGAYVLFACLVALGACKKAEIDPEELTTNPFDKDYVGEAIFGFVAERTVSYQIDTTTFLKLEVDVQVNTALFPKPTNYIVQYELPSGQTLDVPLADLQDDVFTMTVLEVAPGIRYCFHPRLGNNGSYGSGNTICGTAE